MNPWLWGALGLSLALQVAVVYLPPLNDAFSTQPLDPSQWITCLGIASLVLWVVEIKKFFVR